MVVVATVLGCGAVGYSSMVISAVAVGNVVAVVVELAVVIDEVYGCCSLQLLWWIKVFFSLQL